MVSLMRIDDRLIHGQVAYGWATSLGINVILVANDEAKNDQMKAMSLNLAKPSNVTLYIRGRGIWRNSRKICFFKEKQCISVSKKYQRCFSCS